MKKILLFSFVIIGTVAQAVNPFSTDKSAPQKKAGMKLVFSEEFNYVGKPDTTIWNYETGFKRNNELQWYQSENANCSGGRLLIEGKKANFPNPNFNAESADWRINRKTVNYTAASITTARKKTWLFGRFEVRARIDTAMGAWPAIWLLGEKKEWPSCGEIDMLEFYRPDSVPTILANVAWGTKQRYKPKWDSFKKPLKELLQIDKDWCRKYHVWRMDWTKDAVLLYVDDVLFNSTLLSETINGDGTNPFLQPQYLLLNLALGSNGGSLTRSNFPITFEVDYVRIYQAANVK
ncbi:MAG: glycoside hydrolase family 16 protein [Paludibacter sp.]